MKATGTPRAASSSPGTEADASPLERPAALAAAERTGLVSIDVREELRAGREPFSLIMAARREVPPGGVLCVRATFEPAPLYAVMGKQGFAHWTDRLADDDWSVWFYPQPVSHPAAEPSAQPSAQSDAQSDAQPVARAGDGAAADDTDPNLVILDVRGLEPPEPMVLTLAALEQLSPAQTLLQINVRTPQFLLPILEERGFTYEIRQQADDLVRVFIRHTQESA